MASDSNVEDRNVDDTNSISFLTLPPLRTIFAEGCSLSRAAHRPGERHETLSTRCSTFVTSRDLSAHGNGAEEHSLQEMQPSPPLPTSPLNQKGSEHQQANRRRRKRSQINSTSLPTLQPKALKTHPNEKVAIQTQIAALVSKSNYEHMIQNSVPELELFYSDALMANVTARRQNHKLSEKGRRDRMKMALQALSDVISQRTDPGIDRDGTREEIEGRSRSKEVADGFPLEHSDRISIVEAATLYIRQLQEKLIEANRRMDEGSHRDLAIYRRK